MLSSVLSTGMPSLRRTISDYGMRSKSEVVDLVVYGRSESTQVMLDGGAGSASPELREKMYRHGEFCHDFLSAKDTMLTKSASNLLQASQAEMQSTNPTSRAFSRQLYLDSAAYILQCLPSDLTEEELSRLQRAVPANLSPRTLQIEPSSRVLPKPRSILHRSLACTIICLCLILRLFLPYVRVIISIAYRYERTHRVSERVLARTLSATDSVGKKAVEVASMALGSDLVVDGVAYCVDGVCGGLLEGFREGLKGIETKDR